MKIDGAATNDDTATWTESVVSTSAKMHTNPQTNFNVKFRKCSRAILPDLILGRGYSASP